MFTLILWHYRSHDLTHRSAFCFRVQWVFKVKRAWRFVYTYNLLSQ